MALEMEHGALVIDNGGDTLRAGIAGEVAPRIVCHSGMDGRHGSINDMDVDQTAVRPGLGSLDELEEDWDALQATWARAIGDVAAAAATTDIREARPVLLTDAKPLATRASRERLVQIMFETAGVPALHIAPQSVLALFASGRTTGLVLDCGHYLSRAVLIREGFTLPATSVKLPLAGHQLTQYLRRLVADRARADLQAHQANAHEAPLTWNSVRQAKETLCRVSLDFKAVDSAAAGMGEETGVPEQAHELPDGRRIALGAERFRCAEALFQPAFLGLRESGVQHLALEALVHSPVEMRQRFSRNIVLSGGTTMFPGFEDRLRLELKALVPSMSSKLKVEIIAPPERQLLTWMGGSILASMGGFKQSWVTKAEYSELGCAAIHNKCC